MSSASLINFLISFFALYISQFLILLVPCQTFYWLAWFPKPLHSIIRFLFLSIFFLLGSLHLFCNPSIAIFIWFHIPVSSPFKFFFPPLITLYSLLLPFSFQIPHLTTPLFLFLIQTSKIMILCCVVNLSLGITLQSLLCSGLCFVSREKSAWLLLVRLFLVVKYSIFSKWVFAFTRSNATQIPDSVLKLIPKCVPHYTK